MYNVKVKLVDFFAQETLSFSLEMSTDDVTKIMPMIREYASSHNYENLYIVKQEFGLVATAKAPDNLVAEFWLSYED